VNTDTLLAAAAMMFALAAAGPVSGAEIKILSGNGSRAAVGELAAAFESATGNKVSVHFEVNPGVKRRIESGEAFDVAVLNPPVLDALIGQGRVVRETRTVIGRAGIGVGIRAGAPRPDISTVEGFRRTLLGAKAVAYPGEGASGIYFAGLVDRLGLTAAMKSSMKPMPAEYNVEVVASGEADLVVVVASRISGVPGVDLVGLIPQELQTWIGFTAGAGRDAKEPELARSMLRFFTSPTAETVLKKVGIQPFAE
jgi:molybdate transport system substrate-binding protein